MKFPQGLRIKLYLDAAEIGPMKEAYAAGAVKGFTTNPTLMRKAGLTDYETFARQALAAIPDLPISFEVFSDELDEMEAQARTIASWGGTTYVKIPITNTQRVSTAPLIRKLSKAGLRLNVTALLTLEQVDTVLDALDPRTASIISIFAGRIADTGVDPVPIMSEAVRRVTARNPRAEVLWASPRELLNLFQADACGCHILTATPDIIKKLSMVGKDLAELSLDTVKMFRNDAVAAGFTIATGPKRG